MIASARTVLHAKVRAASPLPHIHWDLARRSNIRAQRRGRTLHRMDRRHLARTADAGQACSRDRRCLPPSGGAARPAERAIDAGRGLGLRRCSEYALPPAGSARAFRVRRSEPRRWAWPQMRAAARRAGASRASSANSSRAVRRRRPAQGRARRPHTRPRLTRRRRSRSGMRRRCTFHLGRWLSCGSAARRRLARQCAGRRFVQRTTSNRHPAAPGDAHLHGNPATHTMR